MKKGLLTRLVLAAALLLPLGTRAQVTEFPYFVSFESDMEGWTAIDDDDDGFNWTRTWFSDGTPSVDGNYFVYSESYQNNYGALMPDNWLVSPAITLGDDPMTLSWYTRVGDADYSGEHLAIYVSTTGNTVDDFTGEPVYEVTFDASYHEWTYSEVSLADYAGQTVYIAYRHFDVTDMFWFGIDAIRIAAPSSCEMPQNVEVASLTTTSATLTFDMPGGASSVVVSLDGEEPAGFTGGSATLDNLEPGTTYTARLASICSNGDTTAYVSVIFTTECENVTEYPYNGGFESGNFNCYGTAGAWYTTTNGTYTTYVRSGEYAAYTGASVAMAADSATLMTPTFDIPADAESFIFRVWIAPYNANYTTYNGGSGSNSFQILAVVDGEETLLLDTATTSASLVYEAYTFNIDQFAGQSVRFAIRYTGYSYSASYYSYIFVDDIEVRSAMGPLVTIAGVAQTDIDDEATFVANLEEGSVSGLAYNWTSARAEAGEATMVADDDTLRITYTGGQYDTITLVATNAYGSDTATLVVYIRNCQPIVTLPYVVDINDPYALDCWTIVDNNNDGSTWNRSYQYSFGDTVLYNGYRSDGVDDWLISPVIVLDEEWNSVIIEWMDYLTGYQGLAGHLEVLVSPTASTLLSSFTDTLFSVSESNTSAVTRSVSLAAYAGQSVRVAFRHVNSGDDNGAVLAGINLRATSVPVAHISGPATADVNVAATYVAPLSEGSTDGLTYSWTSAMAEAGNATMVATADTAVVTYTAVGYDTLVLAVTNSFGTYGDTLVVRVRDLAPAALPYATTFGTEDDASWDFGNYTTSGYTGTFNWVIDTAAASDGTHGLYLSADNGLTNAAPGNGASYYNYAVRALNFTAAGEYTVSFDWRNACASSYYGRLRAFLAPAEFDYTQGSGNGISTTLPAGCIALDGGQSLYNNAAWASVQNVVSVPAPGIYLMVFYAYNYSYEADPAAGIDNISMAPLSCSRPSDIVADSIGETAISFHWMPAGEEASWLLTFGTTEPVVVTDTVYTATGLVPATAYTIEVRAICGEGDTSLVRSATVRTDCGIIEELPWTEDFDQAGSEECWTVVSNNSTTNDDWYRSTYGGYMYSSFNANNNSNEWLISPAIAIPADGDGLAFKWDARGSSYQSNAAHLVVLLSTSGIAAASFTDTLYDGDPAESWTTYSASLDQYVGDTIRIAFVHNSYNDNGLSVDNVIIRSVLAPVASVSGPSSAFANTAVTIVASIVEGSTSGLAYAWNSAMATAGNATMTANGDTMTITYTAAGTDVVTLVATNAYGADTVLKNVYVLDCGAISTFPFNEGFEDAEICWTSYDADGDGNDWAPSTDFYYISNMMAHSGSTFYASASYGEDNSDLSPDNWLISQPIQLPADAAYLSWWYECTYEEDPSEHYAVYVATGNAISDFTATTPVHEETLGSDNFDNWQQATVDLSAYLGQTVYVAFRHYNCTGRYYLGIDDVSITTEGNVPQPCNAPTITAANAGQTTVTVVWSGSADSYEVAIVEGGWAAPAAGTVAAGPSYTFGGLTAATQYTVGVRSVCEGNTFSTWTTRTVTTAADTTGNTDTTGIAGIGEVGVSLSPNPASTTVSVSADGLRSVEVADVAGRVVMKQDGLDGSAVMDVRRLAQGVYFVRLRGEGYTAVRKLVVSE